MDDEPQTIEEMREWIAKGTPKDWDPIRCESPSDPNKVVLPPAAARLFEKQCKRIERIKAAREAAGI